MRPISTDPHIRQYDPQYRQVICPECRSGMLPLKDYEISNSESASIDDGDFSFWLWGLSSYVFNYIFSGIDYAWRKRKLARRKKEVLPMFPESWVCTRCLHVTQAF